MKDATTGSLIGGAKTGFTIAVWLTCADTSANEYLFDFKSATPSAGTLGHIYFYLTPKTLESHFGVGDAVATQKDFHSAHGGGFVRPNAWRLWVFTFDATATDQNGKLGELLWYLDGLQYPPFAITNIDFVPSSIQTDMTVTVAATTGGASMYAGLIYDVAIFDVAATPAQVVSMSSVDEDPREPLNYLRNSPDVGYDMAANLTHWFKLGYIPWDMGRDYSLDPLGAGWDIMDNAANIDATDIVGQYPGDGGV
jgi:hypothetical protein